MKIAPTSQDSEKAQWTNLRDPMFPAKFGFSVTYYFGTKAFEGVCLNREAVVAEPMDEDGVRIFLESGFLVLDNGAQPELDPVVT